jgi:hypothetical protein
VSDGRARSAGAYEHDSPRVDLRQPPHEALLKPRPVCVMSDGAAAAEHHGVDRAQRFGIWRELVEVLDHRLLAGIRDVQAAVAELARRPNQLADAHDRQTERTDVDALVDIPQTQLVGLTLVQRWAQGVSDVGAYQSDDMSGGFDH